MSKIRNQNIYHLVDKTGKRTKCGLSNQYKEALTQEKFDVRLSDKSLSKFCCKKCQQSVK